MSTSAERLQPATGAPSTDVSLTRYMRELLRRGNPDRWGPREDVRTCTHCGAFARFDPVEPAATWTACAACGALA